MAFWGGAKLRIEVEKQAIVAPFDADKIDCSAYTLTLGPEAFVTPSFGDDLRQNLKKFLQTPQSQLIAGIPRFSGGGTVVIPPGQFAFLLTEEIVSIPKNTMGFISLKSKAKFKGLINVSGFHVDPGFSGRLIYSVFNAGPSALHLSRGDSLFLLWIADLAGEIKTPYFKTSPGYVEIPSELVSDVSRETHSLQALSDQITVISEQFRTIKNVASGIAVAIGIFLALLALKPVLWDEAPAPAVSDATATVGNSLPAPSSAPSVSTNSENQSGGNQTSGRVE